MKKENLYKLLGLFGLLLLACSKDSPPNPNPGPINLSDEFAECNSRLTDCTGGTGNYCLFGYKWGATPSFSPAGFNVLGPQEAGGTITFSFQESNGLVNTHAQINLPSQSFDRLLSCAKNEIRRALQDWAREANIDFQEEAENSNSDIRFFVADIRQSGVGYPNFGDSPCHQIGGDVVIKTNLGVQNCQLFYLFMLHEIGHALGLGHVGSSNVMNPDFDDLSLNGIGDGDRQGIIELYGKP